MTTVWAALRLALAAVPWSVDDACGRAGWGDQDPNTWWEVGRWRVGVVSKSSLSWCGVAQCRRSTVCFFGCAMITGDYRKCPENKYPYKTPLYDHR